MIKSKLPSAHPMLKKHHKHSTMGIRTMPTFGGGGGGRVGGNLPKDATEMFLSSQVQGADDKLGQTLWNYSNQ